MKFMYKGKQIIGGGGSGDLTQENADKRYLQLAGGTMAGPINMNGTNKIANVPAPTANGDVVNKKYVDDTALLKSGGTMTGIIDMGSKKITNLAAPTVIGDSTNKAYVDNSVTSLNLKLSNLIQSLNSKIEIMNELLDYSFVFLQDWKQLTFTAPQSTIQWDSINTIGNVVIGTGNGQNYYLYGNGILNFKVNIYPTEYNATSAFSPVFYQGSLVRFVGNGKMIRQSINNGVISNALEDIPALSGFNALKPSDLDMLWVASKNDAVNIQVGFGDSSTGVTTKVLAYDNGVWTNSEGSLTLLGGMKIKDVCYSSLYSKYYAYNANSQLIFSGSRPANMMYDQELGNSVAYMGIKINNEYVYGVRTNIQWARKNGQVPTLINCPLAGGKILDILTCNAKEGIILMLVQTVADDDSSNTSLFIAKNSTSWSIAGSKFGEVTLPVEGKWDRVIWAQGSVYLIDTKAGTTSKLILQTITSDF